MVVLVTVVLAMVEEEVEEDVVLAAEEEVEEVVLEAEEEEEEEERDWLRRWPAHVSVHVSVLSAHVSVGLPAPIAGSPPTAQARYVQQFRGRPSSAEQ